MSSAENDSAEMWESAGPDDFEAVLAARATVEQAKGILMERFSLDPEAAFNVLRRYSQHTNRKLRDIAHDLVLTGRLPDDPTGDGGLHLV